MAVSEHQGIEVHCWCLSGIGQKAKSIKHYEAEDIKHCEFDSN